MKNKYFGDIRDLFKYDLIKSIMGEISSLQRFTFIPMLTEDKDGRRDGNNRDFVKAEENFRPGAINKTLVEFLKKYAKIDADKRDFTEIANYFKSNGIEPFIYNYSGDKYFTKSCRDEYFKRIPKKSLNNSLVFVDPDIGLEIKWSNEKHLLFSEVKHLSQCMNDNSILMIYQHFPRARNKSKEYLPEGRSNKLKKETGYLPIYISDNEIVFFLLTKNCTLKAKLAELIARYKESYKNYKKLEIGNVNLSTSNSEINQVNIN